MDSRSETEFVTYKLFDEAVDKFGSANSMQIAADVLRFQRVYRQSNVGSELPKGFEFKLIENARGLYRLCQIYVGPKDNFRAFLMFPHGRIHGRLLACWIYAFKKQRGNDRPQIERAKAIARECWNSLERG